MGDFNRRVLKGLFPQVTLPTRGNQTLDQCFTSIENLYRCSVLPPLGGSDHSTVHLKPDYITKFKRDKPVVKSRLMFNDQESIDKLRHMLETTDWNCLTDWNDFDHTVNVITGYLQFCIETTVPVKYFKTYPNNHPWMNNKVKNLLKEKHG